MTTVESQQHSQPAAADDAHYHSDDAGPSNKSPPLRALRVNLEPSLSPLPADLESQDSPESSPEPPTKRKGSKRSKKINASQGDAVLVNTMGDGKYIEQAIEAGMHALASPSDDDEEASMKGTAINLEMIATGALAVGERQFKGMVEDGAHDDSPTTSDATANGLHKGVGDMMEDVKPTIPTISTAVKAEQNGHTPPEAIKIKGEPQNDGELPPIRQHSPQTSLSNGTSPAAITLPSITTTLENLPDLPDAAPPTQAVAFSHSPPLPRISSLAHSPPKSPSDLLRRELPSPGRGAPATFYYPDSLRRASQVDTPYSAGEYSSSNTETPSTDQSGSTPAMLIDRMSIDGITNPQIGGYQCHYPGCISTPFQTQYLLNSHANVHSVHRPHYCSVKGCPRSEGGKGFKRKNEMIRHGLVHDSPGYVCPFCPDREHKYPRPDNLQRHVRVHHVDKDKDDPELRTVLSQRPEGPSRGRRRRGVSGTS